MNQLRFLINPYFAVLFDPRECGVQVSKDVQNEVDKVLDELFSFVSQNDVLPKNKQVEKYCKILFEKLKNFLLIQLISKDNQFRNRKIS